MAKSKTISRDLQAFSTVLNEYLSYNRREQGGLLEQRASRLRWRIRKQFADIAPSASEIESQAWKRIESGRGIQRRKVNGKRLTLKQEIARRKRSVKYLSVSWMLNKWRASRTGSSGSFDQANRNGRKIGEVILKTAKGIRSPSVKITSFLEGVVVQNKERRIVEKAIGDEIRDMRSYILRKQKERFRQITRQFGIGV